MWHESLLLSGSCIILVHNRLNLLGSCQVDVGNDAPSFSFRAKPMELNSELYSPGTWKRDKNVPTRVHKGSSHHEKSKNVISQCMDGRDAVAAALS